VIVCVSTTAEVPVAWREDVANLGLPLTLLRWEAAALRYHVGRALIRRLRTGLLGYTSAARGQGRAVRTILGVLLDQASPGPEAVDSDPPLRHVGELCAEAGISRSTEWRGFQAAGIHLPSMSGLWLGTQAVVLKAIENPTLEALAWRTGFESHSGLCGMVEAALGIPSGRWSDTAPMVPIAKCSQRWMSALGA
jgi:hypothetical protein